MMEASATATNAVKETIGKLKDVSEKVNPTITNWSLPPGDSKEVNGNVSDNQPSYLHVFDSRTWKVHNIPVYDNFVHGSDLSTITAPIPGGDGRVQKLAVLDPGFQSTACKESSITLM